MARSLVNYLTSHGAGIARRLVPSRSASTSPSSPSARPTLPRPQLRQQRRCLSSWQGHGTDLLSDSLAHNVGEGAPKIVLHGHSPTGFDVLNMVKNKDPSDVELKKSGGIVHMAGSVLAFPTACFLWAVRRPEDLTVASIVGPVLLCRPPLDYLFIGTPNASGIPPAVLDEIRRALKGEDANVVVEPMDLTNAMGTFNILNGEDRRVAVALILPPDEE